MFNNKKESWIVLLVVIGLVAMFLLAGCGESDDAAEPTASEESAGEAAETPEADAPTIEGERYETEKVIMIIPGGWDVMDINGGLQAYKGNYAVEVWVRGSGLSNDDAKAAMEKMAEDYDGSDVVELEAMGLTFYHTYYEYSGMEQTKMSAVKDGERIEVGVTGDDHFDDEEIVGMIDSILIN